MAGEIFYDQPFVDLPTAEYMEDGEWLEVGRSGEIASPTGSQADEPDGLEPDPRRDERRFMQFPS